MRGSVVATLLLLVTSVTMVPVSHATHVDVSDIRWACGFGNGHPSSCGIDPVGGDARVDTEGDPEFLPAGGNDWIPDDARVLGIIHNDDARAYPVRMLNSHEIVNDVVGGDPLAITFCPLCGSGVSFHRQFQWDGETITTNFTASGYLYSTDMVMWDPETNQLWNQITGTPIAWLDEDGPATTGHADAQLELIPTSVTTWDAWRHKYPTTQLLQPVFSPSSYRENAYSVTDPDNCDHGLSGQRDCDVEGLHPKEQMLTYDDGVGGVAFPIRYVAAEPNSSVTYTTDEGQVLQAIADFGGGATLMDVATGETLPTTHMFWFAWHDHRPDTEVWLPESADPPVTGDSGDDRTGLKITITVAIGVIALAFILWSARRP